MLLFLLIVNFIYTSYALFKRMEIEPKKRDYWLGTVIVCMMVGFVLMAVHYETFQKDIRKFFDSLLGRRAPHEPLMQPIDRLYYNSYKGVYYHIVFDGEFLRINSQIRKDGSSLWVNMVDSQVMELDSDRMNELVIKD